MKLSRAPRTLADMPNQPLADRGAITVAEAAAWLGISRWTLYRMIERGDFPPARRIGAQYHVSVPALRAWIGDRDA